MRTAAVELGLSCGIALAPRSGLEVKTHGVPNTISLAWYIGRSIHLARQRKTSYVDAIVSTMTSQPHSTCPNASYSSASALASFCLLEKLLTCTDLLGVATPLAQLL